MIVQIFHASDMGNAIKQGPIYEFDDMICHPVVGHEVRVDDTSDPSSGLVTGTVQHIEHLIEYNGENTYHTVRVYIM